MKRNGSYPIYGHTSFVKHTHHVKFYCFLCIQFYVFQIMDLRISFWEIRYFLLSNFVLPVGIQSRDLLVTRRQPFHSATKLHKLCMQINGVYIHLFLEVNLECEQQGYETFTPVTHQRIFDVYDTLAEDARLSRRCRQTRDFRAGDNKRRVFA